jgi:hypothetical protein
MQRLLEPTVRDDLKRLIAEVAQHQAHHHQCSDRHGRFVPWRQKREAYRAAAAPYGDDGHGFCRPLLARPRLTSRA